MSVKITRNLPVRRRFTIHSESTSKIFLTSKNNLTDGGFTIGLAITKDMSSGTRPSSSVITYPGTSAPPLVTAQRWSDWAGDIFDVWGHFYLYNPETNEYFSPILSPINQADGLITTQQVTAFGRTFTIKHGYPVQGIFKYDISVDDEKEFQFGAYGDMGSDTATVNSNLTQAYTLNNQEFTLYYNKNSQSTTSEIFHFYVIPYEPEKNKNTITYTKLSSGPGTHGGSLEVLSFYTIEVRNGVTLYFAKGNDVKNWIVNDLQVTSSY